MTNSSTGVDLFNYFQPLSDTDVPSDHHTVISSYRAISRNTYCESSNTPLCYRVKRGFTLKDHATHVGLKNWGDEDFKYLREWDFLDKPTIDCLAFWIPCLFHGSTNPSQSTENCLERLNETPKWSKLPEHHCQGFGDASLLAGLILTHSKLTGQRVPRDGLGVFTDNSLVGTDKDRIFLGPFREDGLYCSHWGLVEHYTEKPGAFLLGIESLVT